MNSIRWLFVIIVIVACTGQIASDINAPSIPAIIQAFHTSASLVQLSMALFMLGLAMSQLVWGPLSEGWGRKPPLIIGLTIFIIGNLLCVFAPSITGLIVGRFIQGCGAGACAALWRSIFRDVFEGAMLAKYGAYFSIFITFIIPATPTLGGYLQHYFNWRACFVFLTFYAVATLILVCVRFKETHHHHHQDHFKWVFIRQALLQLLSSRIFMGYSLCTFLCYGAFFCWFSIGPLLLIDQLGMSPVKFGWITLFTSGVATASSGFVNSQLIVKWGPSVMMRLGMLIMFSAGVLMALGHVIFGLQCSVIMIPIFIFYFGVTFIWPSAFSGAFTPFGHIAGYAGALFGFMQIGGAALMGTIVSLLPHTTQLPLASVIVLASVCALLVFEIIIIHH